MLIQSPRHTAEDLNSWASLELRCQSNALLKSYSTHVMRAKDALFSFTGAGACYCGTSWGKDSVVVAHLVGTLVPRVPLVWVRVDPDFNPDCLLVRDEFLRRFPAIRYDEIVVTRDGGKYVAHSTLGRGMRTAAERYGMRYISGIRAEESGSRKLRMNSFSENTASTCAPIGRFSGLDVFTYLLENRLPIHPAYACSMGGTIPHERIRVSPLGGERGARVGDGMGRAEWEDRYYREELIRIRKADT